MRPGERRQCDGEWLIAIAVGRVAVIVARFSFGGHVVAVGARGRVIGVGLCDLNATCAGREIEPTEGRFNGRIQRIGQTARHLSERETKDERVLVPCGHEAGTEMVGERGLRLISGRCARCARTPSAAGARHSRRRALEDRARSRARVVLGLDAILYVRAEGSEAIRAVAAARRAECCVWPSAAGRARYLDAASALALKRGQA